MSELSVRRADSERNRGRLMAVARDVLEETGVVPGLAELAARAGLGVGTVYRHFPTPAALSETLAVGRLETLRERGQDAVTSGGPGGLEAFLRDALSVVLHDANVAAVFASPNEATSGAGAAKAALFTVLTTLVDRARVEGLLRPELTGSDIHHLVCGIQFGLRLVPGADDAAAARYSEVLLAGLRP